jgi:hypothetical protein
MPVKCVETISMDSILFVILGIFQNIWRIIF